MAGAVQAPGRPGGRPGINIQLSGGRPDHRRAGTQGPARSAPSTQPPALAPPCPPATQLHLLGPRLLHMLKRLAACPGGSRRQQAAAGGSGSRGRSVSGPRAPPPRPSQASAEGSPPHVSQQKTWTRACTMLAARGPAGQQQGLAAQSRQGCDVLACLWMTKTGCWRCSLAAIDAHCHRAGPSCGLPDMALCRALCRRRPCRRRAVAAGRRAATRRLGRPGLARLRAPGSAR